MEHVDAIEIARKKIEQWLWRRSNEERVQKHCLNYFFWESTLRCNLSCLHCGSDCVKDSGSIELSAEKVMKVFRDIAKNYSPGNITVAITGGEPLVRKDLFKVTAEINRLGFPWGMVTNGTLVDDKVVENCFRTGMYTVVVSLDGIGETHNWLRNNKYAYDKAINALKLFITSEKFRIVEVITCANPQNIDQLDMIYDKLIELGVNAWRIFSIFPKGRAVKNRELVINRELLIKLLEFIKRKRTENPGWPLSYSEEGYLGCKYEGEVRDQLFYCPAGVNVGGLLSDGSYSSCPSLARNWIQGHVDELSFSEAWETRYGNMRDREWMANKSCNNCPELKNCNNSSLHLWDWEKHRPSICHYRFIDR